MVNNSIPTSLQLNDLSVCRYHTPIVVLFVNYLPGLSPCSVPLLLFSLFHLGPIHLKGIVACFSSLLRHVLLGPFSTPAQFLQRRPSRQFHVINGKPCICLETTTAALLKKKKRKEKWSQRRLTAIIVLK
ncbi:hypothetical protein J3459_008358 [Metarhizium acridum]|uniref:uncharacterized protein n=1 Tax=Metarhizium acridum TaxID=92637 RepID=UPI001C6AD204|nr:hypothetical protein J3458_000552 [Metarhizium acridum]KAG8426148.1 hypothetical protein J3459_008409 [Metarhizium acridum]KAG8426179.1 hypothetical protein J3459_008358 [Metarhizium acridum]